MPAMDSKDDEEASSSSASQEILWIILWSFSTRVLNHLAIHHNSSLYLQGVIPSSSRMPTHNIQEVKMTKLRQQLERHMTLHRL